MESSRRKNWTTLVLGGHVAVSFGEEDPRSGWAGGLTVSCGGMESEFSPVPSAELLTELVDFLLRHSYQTRTGWTG